MTINLTQKEQFLLQDEKSHEQMCIKKYNDYANKAQDPQLKQLFLHNASQEQDHLNSINSMLGGQVPNVNSQQSSGGQNSKQPTITPGEFNQADKDLCEDLLATEKYISDTYNTAIFEFCDTNARQVLNHIQKEEQEHGEHLFKYMKAHNMYQPK